ncbi:MAG TPA: alpha/beta hydrolase [Anaerolineales bacterium]|nr:alpha/beta hydrolase [Anaerolineales bacterium]
MKVITQSPLTPVKLQTAKSRSRVFIWLKRIALGLAIGIGSLAVIGAAYQTIATAIDQRAFPPPRQLIDVGGYQMHLNCTGTNVDGRPTVILENGLGSTSSAWALVQSEVTKATRVCSYDRAGTGWSDAGPEPRDARHIARELHTLLQNANIPGPYILVGWSMGGLYAREYAGQYGDQVAGLVLVDSSHPDQWMSTPGGQKQFESNAKIYSVAPILARLSVMRIMGLRQPDSGLPTPYNEERAASFAATKDWDAQSAEFLDSPASMTQVRESKLRDNLPLFVLTATEHSMSPEQEDLWQVWQTDLALLSTNSIHLIVERANHASFWRDPTMVKASVAAILQVVKAARSGNPLKP